MKTTFLLLVSWAALQLGPRAVGQTTALTYQGRLQHGGNAANGLYEISFALHDAVTNGSLVGVPVTVAPVPVTNGLFTASPDFGAAAFMGADRWLEITVTPFGSDQPPVTLVPRQPLTPTPYALHAYNAAGLMTYGDGPLDIKVNGVRALRLEAGTFNPQVTGAPNVIGGSPGNSVSPLYAGVTIAGGGATNYHGQPAINTAQSDLAAIGGGGGNNIQNQADGATIAGGLRNTIFTEGFYSTIGGGLQNTIADDAHSATISGGRDNQAMNSGATVGGGENNRAGFRATVGGGADNRAGDYGTVGGGLENRATGGLATVGGGAANIAAGEQAVVGGGVGNAIDFNAANAVIGGGESNLVLSFAVSATIGGGRSNTNDSDYATVGGGLQNATRGVGATVGGGIRNLSSGDSATIGGGLENVSSGEDTTVAGGAENTATAPHAAVGGGFRNHADSEGTTIAGGLRNSSAGTAATVGGGEGNISADDHATVSGGLANTSTDLFATVGGGGLNRATGFASVIAGGGGLDFENGDDRGNTASGPWSVVSGGADNLASYSFATIGGGEQNVARDWHSTVAGGRGNIAAEEGATIGGGGFNLVSGGGSTIAGGGGNEISASGVASFIGGGASNTNEGGYGVICGGELNHLGPVTGGVIGGGTGNRIGNSAAFATVPGGFFNHASGRGSLAAGTRAEAGHEGAFVWADFSVSSPDFHSGTAIPFSSVTTNEFAARATGGVRFVTAIDTNGSNIAGVTLASGSGAWSSLSDRNAKENFALANSLEVLEKVAALPLASWNYKAQDKSVRHLGPMAQDFHAAFGLGESDRTITSVDADGVALAAIQGLNAKLEAALKAKEARLRALEEELATLKVLVARFARPGD